MSEVLEIQDKQDYIHATYSGVFSVEASKRVIDKLIQAGSGNAQYKVLLDCRSMTGALPVFDRYQVVSYGVNMVGKVSRFALVRKKEPGPIDLFTETVARNRGINMKIFTDIDQALDWLKT
jgi:hypothetical protein